MAIMYFPWIACIALYNSWVIGYPLAVTLPEVKSRRSCSPNALVALTRELGHNDKLSSMLRLRGVESMEFPCIRFEVGEEEALLEHEIPKHDVVVLTSPKAASVFIPRWRATGSPPINIVSIGHGTTAVLKSQGVEPVFAPTLSNAQTLGRELTHEWGRNVLYPTSSLASDDLVTALSSRNFKVFPPLLVRSFPR